MAKRIGWWTGAVMLLGLAVSAAVFRPDRAMQAGAGLTAHNLCSAVFVAGLPADDTYREMVLPMLGRIAGSLVSYQVDRHDRSVEASFIGIRKARARFTPGYGCRLDYPENVPAPAPLAAKAPVDDDFAPRYPVTSTDPVIAAAIERVFREDPEQPVKHVKAVVIVKDGHVVAERYAPGFGIDTPVLSWSVAKSFTNALLGILVGQGRLRVDQPLAAPEWTGAGDDPRLRVTIEDLMRMQSGLDVEESESGFSPVARMEFTLADMAGFAARHPLKDPPGKVWEYTSADTLLLSRLLGQTVGGGATGMRDFAEKELFAPLHMASPTMEFDGAGTFLGSSYVHASARDYARLGQLYVNDGIAPDGRRILPEGWVAWSRHSALGAPYGAGFWTNDGPSRVAAVRVANGFPKDGFYASGILGERIYIVPSERLVIVRLGYSRPPDFGIQDDIALISAAIKAP
jgi:CubicO group peptidase (beta-lactamase class C family)